MSSPQNFNAFALTLPEKQILCRLGFNRHITQVSAAQMEQMRQTMRVAFNLCAPKGRFAIATIGEIGERQITLADGTIWESEKLAENLRGASRVAIFAATVGQKISDAANEKIAAGNGADALIFDATASETVELAITQMDEFIGRSQRAIGRVKHRFSPGYGGWEISAQASIDAWLNLSTIGITLDQNFRLSPEKTITAVHGLP